MFLIILFKNKNLFLFVSSHYILRKLLPVFNNITNHLNNSLFDHVCFQAQDLSTDLVIIKN